jgi:superfamily II DNA helicase RecQ
VQSEPSLALNKEKKMSVLNLKKLIQKSTYTQLIAHNKGESISMLYDPWKDNRISLEVLDSQNKEERKKLFEALGVKGCIKVTPKEAEKLLLESQQYYREALSV